MVVLMSVLETIRPDTKYFLPIWDVKNSSAQAYD